MSQEPIGVSFAPINLENARKSALLWNLKVLNPRTTTGKLFVAPKIQESAKMYWHWILAFKSATSPIFSSQYHNTTLTKNHDAQVGFLAFLSISFCVKIPHSTLKNATNGVKTQSAILNFYPLTIPTKAQLNLCKRA